jgi:hypothetical protein
MRPDNVTRPPANTKPAGRPPNPTRMKMKTKIEDIEEDDDAGNDAGNQAVVMTASRMKMKAMSEGNWREEKLVKIKSNSDG